MRLLDLFCGAGGCSVGYHRAGFDVVGVDIEPQKNYPYDFHQGDALEFLAQHGHEFDAIHASPPCQAYSVAAQHLRNAGGTYPDLLGPTRDLLTAVGVPWVIENVPGAPMRADLKLCGCHFHLPLRRERWFETSWGHYELSPPHHHNGPVVSVTGHGTPSWVKEMLGYNPSIHQYREAMGIDWMGRNELSQAVPPAYTEHVGSQLMTHLTERGGTHVEFAADNP